MIHLQVVSFYGWRCAVAILCLHSGGYVIMGIHIFMTCAQCAEKYIAYICSLDVGCIRAVSYSALQTNVYRYIDKSVQNCLCLLSSAEWHRIELHCLHTGTLPRLWKVPIYPPVTGAVTAAVERSVCMPVSWLWSSGGFYGGWTTGASCPALLVR